jgi:hypothetical protein
MPNSSSLTIRYLSKNKRVSFSEVFIVKEVWQMTPAQYRAHRINEVRSEYHCTVAEAEKCVWMPKYWKAIGQSAYDGMRIPNTVLDRMDDFTFYSVMKRARAGGYDTLYAGYIRPQYRPQDKFGRTTGRG